MKSECMEFLLSRYALAGISPEYVVVNRKKYIIPYEYFQNNKEPLKTFLTDFFDVMRKDYVLYKRYKCKVRYVTWHDGVKNRHLIVPFYFRNLNVSTDQIAEKIINKASKKYKRAVMIACELAKAYPTMIFDRMIKESSLAVMLKTHKTWQLKQNRNMAVYITKKVGSYLSKNPKVLNENIITLYNLKQKAKKWALRIVLCAAVASSVYTAINTTKDNL